MKTFKYSDRHKLFPNVRIISHNTSWGGSFKDHHLWMAEFNGEVDDYATKKQLIADAIKHNLPYVVLRVHRNGNATNCGGLAPTVEQNWTGDAGAAHASR